MPRVLIQVSDIQAVEFILFESGILFFIKCLQNILEKQDVCVHTTNFHVTNQINQINKDSVL